jgi:hypothetical protein
MMKVRFFIIKTMEIIAKESNKLEYNKSEKEKSSKTKRYRNPKSKYILQNQMMNAMSNFNKKTTSI